MSLFKALGEVARAVDEMVDSAARELSNRSDLERKLDEALSKANYGVPQSFLREIAQETFDP